jgi:hypothetical protein
MSRPDRSAWYLSEKRFEIQTGMTIWLEFGKVHFG